MISECYIFDAIRSPRGRGKADGAMHTTTSVQVLSQLYRTLKKRSLSSKDQFDLVTDSIIGCVSAVGEQGANIGRSAMLAADYPTHIPAIHVNRFCASSLSAINMAAAQINAHNGHAIVTGGIEMMSRVPMAADRGALMVDPQIVYDQTIVPLGISADLIASKRGYTRECLDQFALDSHSKAQHATEKGYFNRSIIPILNTNHQIVLEKDEAIRPGSALEMMAKLPASFEMIGQMGGFDAAVLEKFPYIEQMQHLHSPGNSSSIVDGAALLLLGNGALKATGLTPRARVLTYADIGTDTTDALSGPAAAAQKALKNVCMSSSDVDLWEINEAFSAVALQAIEDLDIDPSCVNVNGGSIAMGHPLGATGAILVGTLVDELERRNLNTGVVTMCIGSGMATATVIERC